MNDILLDNERYDKVNEDISLIQKKGGLTFGTDAYLLASYIKPRSVGKAVELGTGTGIISLLCAAKNKFKKIYAVEIQEDFAELAKRNVLHNSLGEKIDIICDNVTVIGKEKRGGNPKETDKND